MKGKEKQPFEPDLFLSGTNGGSTKFTYEKDQVIFSEGGTADSIFYIQKGRVKIVDQQVYVNGQKLDEPYAYHDPAAAYDPFLYNFPPANHDELLSNMQPEWASQIFNFTHDGEVLVPPNHYFAMGDNRDHSWDSRYWGFVDREAIMGRPVVIYWSVLSSEDEYADRSVSGGIAGIIDGLIHLPTRTRWHRMLRTVH